MKLIGMALQAAAKSKKSNFCNAHTLSTTIASLDNLETANQRHILPHMLSSYFSHTHIQV